LEYFCCIVVLQNALEIWFIDIGVGAAEPRKIGEKKSKFQNFCRVWRSLGENISAILARGWFFVPVP